MVYNYFTKKYFIKNYSIKSYVNNYKSLTYLGTSVSTMFSNWSISWRIPRGSSGAGLLLFPPSSQVPISSSIFNVIQYV